MDTFSSPLCWLEFSEKIVFYCLQIHTAVTNLRFIAQIKLWLTYFLHFCTVKANCVCLQHYFCGRETERGGERGEDRESEGERESRRERGKNGERKGGG